jgi:thioredoxin 1
MTAKLTDDNFDKEMSKSSKPVLVDFWAEWCAPCKQMAVALDELSGELGSKITIAKLNVDENPNVPLKYGVKSVPTMMIFKGGQVAATKVGQLSKLRLKEWIDSSL